MSADPIRIESLCVVTLITFQDYIGMQTGSISEAQTTPWPQTNEMDDVITHAAERLGYSSLSPNQHKAVKAFLEGNEVFLSLLAGMLGSGKSLCYAILPFVFDDLYEGKLTCSHRSVPS